MTPFSLKFLLKTQYKVPLRNTHEAKKSQRHRKLKENSKMWNVTNPKSRTGCQSHFTLIYWQHKNWSLKIVGSDLKPDLSAEDKSSLVSSEFFCRDIISCILQILGCWQWHCDKSFHSFTPTKMTGSALFITCLSQGVHKGWRMVNERLCETARLAFFFASQRHFDFLDCETETFECECKMSRLLKLEPQIWSRAMKMS